MRIGVIPSCINCGADIGPEVFPHYCPYCLDFIRRNRSLPSGLLEQMRLEDEKL
jgi:predicted RNA-binding Zn-ribbon protein involved in translation (DUF1610 family)